MLTSVPEYLPYKTTSPVLTVIGSSFFPFPTAITLPLCGFSLAVSGIIIPPAVFSSAAAGSIITLSANGLIFNDIILYFLVNTNFYRLGYCHIVCHSILRYLYMT